MKLIINNLLISNNLKIADTFLKRLLGLMFKKIFNPNDALLIKPCKIVHSFFMNFEIDILFIDKNNNIIGTYTLKPWRISPYYKNAEYVIELPYKTLEKYKIKYGKVVIN